MYKWINSFFTLTAVILLFVIQASLISCPRCNDEFYNELLGKRANTLGGQELLQAIKNQTVSDEPAKYNLPSSNSIYESNALPDFREVIPIERTNKNDVTPQFLLLFPFMNDLLNYVIL